MSVSVDSGRWGPCCSVEPSGTASTDRLARASTSGQVSDERWTGPSGSNRRSPSQSDRDGVPGAGGRGGADGHRLEQAGPVPLDALRVRALEGQPGEELRGHAPALARVV